MRYNFLIKELGWTSILHFAVEDDEGKTIVEGGYGSPVKQELYDFASLAIKLDYYPDAKIVSVANRDRFRTLTDDEMKGLEKAVKEKRW
ncbi:MAG: hypothetical protein PHO02_02885 [Candidatus Nanoarchaeia archaeon]|nr:hypothetical protein [Candidatus Nanoarchaeia archaeon]